MASSDSKRSGRPHSVAIEKMFKAVREIRKNLLKKQKIFSQEMKIALKTLKYSAYKRYTGFSYLNHNLKSPVVAQKHKILL